MLKRLSWSEPYLALVGFLISAHFRLVGWTNRVVHEPADGFYGPFESNKAVIVALWHGEHFLLPFLGWPKDRSVVLVTTHRDGELVARAGGYFGLNFIRGSGDHGREFLRKKAVRAFATMLRFLKKGTNVISTADVPKVARVAGRGLVTLAKHSGCPILPVAMASSRCLRFNNWDQTCFNLPFGRMVFVRGEPIYVASDADDAGLEAARLRLQSELDAVTARAYDIAGAPHKTFQSRAAA
ncbi:MAG: hypothetical protein QOD74_888 [Variibacter sp.]|jgi:lysophospholipid acyltransferase (LPLAT)-like uncharacterized protein|nr:hypothetical protein [Variibacter sp.]